MVSFEASFYSVPARRVRAGQRVELRVSADLVVIHALPTATSVGELLAVHPRAAVRGSWAIDPTHWDGLPDGHTRATTLDPLHPPPTPAPAAGEPSPLAALLAGNPAAATPVARRPLSTYQAAALAAIPDLDRS
jgi:hypothetical protein